MTKGATFSLLLHVFVVLLAFFGLPVLAKPDPVLEKPIMVDIVTIAKVTNLPPPTPKVEPKPEPKVVEPEPPKPEPPKPEPPKVVEAPPPPPPPAPPPPPPPPKVVEPKPEPPKPEPPKPAEVKPEPAPKVAELKPEPPKPEPPKVEPPKPEPPKPVAKVDPPKPAPPKPEPPKPQPKRDDTGERLLKDLANKKPAPEPPPAEAKKPEPPKPQQQAALPPTPNRSPPPRAMTEGQLTLSELDAIRSQIAQCWNVPAGARDARNLVVELQVEMNPDATVRTVRVVDESRMMTDNFFRAAAESALRAVRNPRCNPLRLPPDKFDTWKSFTLNFNPKEML